MTAGRAPLPTVSDPGALIREPAGLTPEWLSRTLRFPVRTATYAPIGTGQIGGTYRVELGYDRKPDGAPDTVVAKFAIGTAEQRARLSPTFVSEVGFYLHLADRARARIPDCWYAAISDDRTWFTLILEDLTPSRPGSQAAGCTPAQAQDAVGNLAALHTSFWNDEFLATGLEWITPVDAETAALIGAVLPDAVTLFAERFGAALPAEDAATLAAAAPVVGPWLLRDRTPFSLIHGDYRLDNLMFPPSGAGSVALDWQGLSIGHPCRDLAYFVAMSLAPEERRAHEDGLIAAYHGALGVDGFSLDDCRAGYRTGMLQGPLITVLGCVFSAAERTAAADAMFLSMTARTCQAIRDLGTIGLVTG